MSVQTFWVLGEEGSRFCLQVLLRFLSVPIWGMSYQNHACEQALLEKTSSNCPRGPLRTDSELPGGEVKQNRESLKPEGVSETEFSTQGGLGE